MRVSWRRLRRALVFALALLTAVPAAGSELLRLDLGRIEHPLFVLDGLTVVIGGEGELARIRVAHLAVGERHWSDVALECPQFRLDESRIRCSEGTLDVPGLLARARLTFEFDRSDQRGRFSLRTRGGETVQGVLTATGSVDLELGNLDLARVVAWLPQSNAWSPSGRLNATLTYEHAADRATVAMEGRLSDASFSSADGLNAAEGLVLDVALNGISARAGWDWRASVTWVDGEAYIHPVFLQAGAQVQAAGRVSGQRLQLHRATLEAEGLRSAELVAELGLNPLRIEHAKVTVTGGDLAVLGPRYIAPILAPARADGLSFSGQVNAELSVERDALVGFEATLDNVEFGLIKDELSFGPVTGRIPWQADAPGQAVLAVGGGRWRKLELGPFDVNARLAGPAVTIDRVAIPLLDGRLVFSELELLRDHVGWSGQGGVIIEPISMALLTRAAGLPEMTGALTASLPGLVISPGEMRLEGVLVISVFEGYLQATRLQLFEPFGVASRLFADVTARNINLAQLTDTFAFGTISGFVDADVSGLELVRWQPVRFDASVRSSPGRYERRISQRAVQNISALGGAGATAVLQRGFLGFFESFGYRELGLSCRLAAGVCIMDGLEARSGSSTADGFVIVRGGGIPALNVIGYNRRVDWQELLDRLHRVIESNVPPVIE